jgi:CheY-like chemotaxis protein
MGSELILVVDDNPDMRSYMSDVLIPEGYTVIHARDGENALEELRLHAIDLIITDLTMPRMDGATLIDHINKNHGLPIIVMTGEGSESIAVELFRRGVRDYLIKGGEGAAFSPKDVIEAVERSLSEIRLQRDKEDLTHSVHKLGATHIQRKRELKALYQLGREMTRIGRSHDEADQNRLMVFTLGSAHQLLESHENAIYLREGNRLVCRCLFKPGDDRPHPVRYIEEDSLVRDAINTGKIAVTGQHRRKGIAIAGAMAAPLMHGRDAIGAIVIHHHGAFSRDYNPDARDFLSGLSDYLSLSIKPGMLSNSRHTKTTTDMPIVKFEPDALVIPDSTVFISYSRTDWEQFSQPLVDMLHQHDFNLWYDQESIEGGANWLNQVTEALNDCKVMLLCETPEALKSPFVQMEYQYFFLEQKPILPVICKASNRRPPPLVTTQYVAFENTNGIIRELRKLLAKGVGVGK